MSTELTVGTFSPSVLLRVARRTGRLAKQGLAVEERPVHSSPGQFRSLLDGDLDAILTSPDNVLAYRYSPSNPIGHTTDVRIVSAVDRGLGLGLYARPGLGSSAQLVGATFGVDVPMSGFAFAMFALAESIGLRRDDYEVVPLGSTPRRLDALLAGACDATMLNAGNELLAEQAGCLRLARVADQCAPYLGTVLGIAGPTRLQAARQLAHALQATAASIVASLLDDVVIEEAAASLDLPGSLALRYLQRLKDPVEGLVVDGQVDPASLATVVELRRRYLPSVVDGVDVLAQALEPGSALVTTPTPQLG